MLIVLNVDFASACGLPDADFCPETGEPDDFVESSVLSDSRPPSLAVESNATDSSDGSRFTADSALEAGEIFSSGRFVKGSPSDVDVCSGDSDDADKQPEQPARENVHTHKNSVTCRPNGELACP